MLKREFRSLYVDVELRQIHKFVLNILETLLLGKGWDKLMHGKIDSSKTRKHDEEDEESDELDTDEEQDEKDRDMNIIYDDMDGMDGMEGGDCGDGGDM